MWNYYEHNSAAHIFKSQPISIATFIVKINLKGLNLDLAVAQKWRDRYDLLDYIFIYVLSRNRFGIQSACSAENHRIPNTTHMCNGKWQMATTKKTETQTKCLVISGGEINHFGLRTFGIQNSFLQNWWQPIASFKSQEICIHILLY